MPPWSILRAGAESRVSVSSNLGEEPTHVVPASRSGGGLEGVRHVNLLGVNVHLLQSQTIRPLIRDFISAGEKRLVLNVNCNCLNLAYENPWLRDFLNSADLVFCDGVGVLIGARILGQRIPERIPFTDWDWGLGRESERGGYSLFLLGARPGVAERAAARLREAHPDLVIAGVQHGYFDKARDSAENQAVVRAINSARPNMLIVCFGMPLQERWLMENWSSIDANVAMVGGAALDYMAGDLRRPPVWMRRHSMEWLGRVMIEPRRLWRRYLLGNGLFLMRVLKQRASSPSAS